MEVVHLKKTHVIITSFAIASLCGMSAFAAPANKPAPAKGEAGNKMVPPPAPHAEKGEDRFADRFANAPEEIKKSAAEMKSLGKDLRLELCKDNPDSAKAMEMFTKLQELRTKVHGWLVQEILNGNAPKPDMHGMKKGPHGPHHGGPAPHPGDDHLPPAPFECHCREMMPYPPDPMMGYPAQPMPPQMPPMGGPMPLQQPAPSANQ